MPTIKSSASIHKPNSYRLYTHTHNMFSTHVQLSHFNRFRLPVYLVDPHHFIFPSSGARLYCCQHLVCVFVCVCVCVCLCYTFVDKPDISVTGIKSNTIRVVVVMMMMMMTSSRWRPDFVIGSSSCRDSTSKTDY